MVPNEAAVPILKEYLTGVLKRKPAEYEINKFIRALDPDDSGDISMEEFM